MRETSWLESKRRKGRMRLIIGIVLALGVAGIFFLNNRDLFSPRKALDSSASVSKKKPPVHGDVPPAEHSSSDIPPLPNAEHHAIDKRHAPVHGEKDLAGEGSHPQQPGDQPVSKAALHDDHGSPSQKIHGEDDRVVAHAGGPALRVELPGISSRIADRKDLKVLISLDLVLAGPDIEDEILLKREDLKIMAINVLTQRTLEQMMPDQLRPVIKNQMNQLLGGPLIDDVEFKDFRIE